MPRTGASLIRDSGFYWIRTDRMAVTIAGAGLLVLFGITKRFEYVDAPEGGNRPGPVPGAGDPMKGNRIAIAIDRMMWVVDVHASSVNCVKTVGRG
jgi:hypothetical protein